MKKANLLYNPSAGDEGPTQKELAKLIENEGFECIHASVRDDSWKELDNSIDFLVIAGGDGTVRQVSKALLERKRLDKQFPVALLPQGTANNIACALGVDGELAEIVKAWHSDHRKQFDIGKVYGLKKELFFLESFGYGLFPRLIKVMDKIGDDEDDSVAKKLRTARAVLYDIVLNYKAKACKIIADGSDYSGEYLLVEVMNIRSLGPNLILAPGADPGDGELEIVLVSESERSKFEAYVLDQINEGTETYTFTTIQAKSVQIQWDGNDLHVDDELLKLDGPVEVDIEVQPGMMEFIVTTTTEQ